MYSVIATDLDGTLLHSDHTLDPFTTDTIRPLAARGVHIIIATGRHYRDVAGIRDPWCGRVSDHLERRACMRLATTASTRATSIPRWCAV